MCALGHILDCGNGSVTVGEVDPGDRYTAEMLPDGRVQCFGRIYKFVSAMLELKSIAPDQDIILDCGAAHGEFAAECFNSFPQATVHSFEPVASLYEALKHVADKRECHHAHKLALLDVSGKRTINLTKSVTSNSFLGFLPDHPLADPHEIIGREEVDCVTLDEWCAANIPDLDRVTLLKMDLQGSELFALRGAGELLKHVKAVYIEVVFVPVYEQCPVDGDIDAFLRKSGFERAVLFGGPRPDVWANALYLRSELMSDNRNGKTRLNIGSGMTHIDGYIDIDRKIGSEAYPLSYADESVDEIRASHILEHFSFGDSLKVLQDWTRVLKNGGRMRIAVPDFDRIIGLSRVDQKWHFYLMGGQSDENDFHRSVWTADSLRTAMEKCGLSDIRFWQGSDGDCSEHPCSLNLEGVKNGKPRSEPTSTIRICAVMSIPRVGWNDNWGHTIEALQPFRIPIRRFNGVYWGQCMQRAFNECLEDEIDWILTIDYDTVFTSRHLDRLMTHFASRPDIDAIAALQSRRGQQFPLMTIGQQKECQVTTDPVRVTTAHFGLTLIRTDCLRDVAKPWFYTKPDDNNEYGDQRLDDDIWFWHQWRRAGKTIYVAMDVLVGHIEPMIATFDVETGEHKHVYVQDWRDQHLPEKIRKKKCPQTQA